MYLGLQTSLDLYVESRLQISYFSQELHSLEAYTGIYFNFHPFKSLELVYRHTLTSNPTFQRREPVQKPSISTFGSRELTSFASTLNSTPHSQELVYKPTLSSNFAFQRPTRLQIPPFMAKNQFRGLLRLRISRKLVYKPASTSKFAF